MPLRKFILLLTAALFLFGCTGDRETLVERGTREGILHKGNGQEPEDLDPHIINGVSEFNIIAALLEGLVTEDPKTLEPIPGMAERWEISEDGREYTFYLREAKWSNGDPVTAADFVFSYQRLLSPELGGGYAYMLYGLKNAEAFHKGDLKDFSEVGIEARDERTLRLSLEHPIPYFLSMLNHWTWFPVHKGTILAHGSMYDRGTNWTRPGNYVGNGPFVLKDWKVGQLIEVAKNPLYYDADTVRLNGIRFYPIGDQFTEERAFRSGKLHVTYKLPLHKIAGYREKHPESLRVDPYLESVFYCFNVTHPPLDDVRVRSALSAVISRELLVKTVLKGGKKPAFTFTPPGTAGYTATATIETDVKEAQALLAEAGYPNGEGFPSLELLYVSSDTQRPVAEAIQQIWKETLGVTITLNNQEWKSYINTRRQKDFDICRFGWVGDYLDPNTFLDMWVTDGGNNVSGWSNPEYDRAIQDAARLGAGPERLAAFDRAETVLLDQLPITPIYFGTTVYAKDPSVQNWHPTLIDHHPYKAVYLQQP